MVGLVAASCGSSGHSATRATLPTVTTSTEPPTTTTTAVSALTVIGVSPGVNQDPFYPSATVSSVTCGNAPSGRFVRFAVPGGGSDRQALAATTTVTVTTGKAVLTDHTGKILYEEDRPSITVAARGAFVLSLVSSTFVGGDGKSVNQGAMNISGNYACPPAESSF